MALGSLPTINNVSDWPTVMVFLASGPLSSDFSLSPLSAPGEESDFSSARATSAPETVRVMNSRSRIFSVLSFLPESTHFFLRSARLVFS